MVQYSNAFGQVLATLRSSQPIGNRGFLSKGALIIKHWATEQWQLGKCSQGFSVKTSQRTILLADSTFGSLFANVSNRIVQSTDRAVVDALNIIRACHPDIPAFLTGSLLALFLAHEFFHIEQKLGSDQYADSDHYGAVVAAADYQADLVALDYVFRTSAAPSEQKWALLFILLVIHIFVMQEFAPLSPKNTMNRAVFDRLLVWHFQAARIGSSRACPDLAHPGFMVMPVISLPRLEPYLGATIKLQDLSGVRRKEKKNLQDMVVALSDADGVLRISRITMTSPERAASLVKAILNQNFETARDETEELFRTHEHLLYFEGKKSKLIASIESCLVLGSQFISDTVSLNLSPDDSGVVDYFERIQILIDRKDLDTAEWRQYSSQFPRGLFDALESARKRITGLEGRTPTEKGEDLSREIKREILRLQVRLRETLDGLVSSA